MLDGCPYCFYKKLKVLRFIFALVAKCATHFYKLLGSGEKKKLFSYIRTHAEEIAYSVPTLDAAAFDYFRLS